MGLSTPHLLRALLLLLVPGSSALRGPGAVQGWERDSLTVECRYDQGYETYRKLWLRRVKKKSVKILVQTSGSEQEVKHDRVSIRDHHKYRTFTVTMQKLRLEDADTYCCGIERRKIVLCAPVEVTVDRAPTTVSTTRATTTITTTTTTTNATTIIAPVTLEEGTGPPTAPSNRELLLPLTVAAVLLLVLMASLLAWRVVQWQRRAAGISPEQPPESKLGYANVALHQKDTPEMKATARRVSPVGMEVEAEYANVGPFQKDDVSYAVLSLSASGQEPTYGNMEQFATRDPRRGREEPTEYSAIRKH